MYLRNDKEYRHIRSTKNKGGYLPCAAVPFILAYLSSAVYTGWIKGSLVQFCNLNFFDTFWSLLPYISETTENLGPPGERERGSGGGKGREGEGEGTGLDKRGSWTPRDFLMD